MTKLGKDLRFDVPLYTMAEAARIVSVPTSTFVTWAQGYERRSAGRPVVKGAPVVTAFDGKGVPSVPFVGLAESLVLAAVRRSGVPMQRIRPALDAVRRELGMEYALASRRLYTDGAEMLYDYGTRPRAPEREAALELVVVRSGQRVFTDVVADYLRRIEWADDGLASLIHVPGYVTADVVCDPERSFGKPIFVRGGARIADVLERFWVGETIEELVAEFGVPATDLEDALRVASRRAA